MKTVIIEQAGECKVIDREKPAAGRGEILVKLKYVGFCGSDLSTYIGKNPMVQYPRVPGHEISAEIEQPGEAVPEGFKAGQAVTVVPYTNCGQCPSCRHGRAYACQFNQTLGIQRDGAMQEYLSIPWQKVLKAPALNELELAMVEPLTVGFHAIERGRVTDSDTVMVMGCGMIGAGAIVRASLRGATVIAVDIDDYKLELARDLGARYCINSEKADLHEELVRMTGYGPDVVVEAVGDPITYRTAVDEVAFTGRVLCIGYAEKEVSFATKFFVQKELDILGSRNATAEDVRAVKTWSENPGKVMKILLDFS